MKYAQVKNGIVVNVVLWDGISDFPQPEETILVSIEEISGVGIGWSYDGNIFSPPIPVPIPPYRVSKDTITMRVLEAGKLNDLITLIPALTLEQQFLWNNLAWFWSNNSTIIAIANQLNLNPDIVLAPDQYLI